MKNPRPFAERVLAFVLFILSWWPAWVILTVTALILMSPTKIEDAPPSQEEKCRHEKYGIVLFTEFDPSQSMVTMNAVTKNEAGEIISEVPVVIWNTMSEMEERKK